MPVGPFYLPVTLCAIMPPPLYTCLQTGQDLLWGWRRLHDPGTFTRVRCHTPPAPPAFTTRCRARAGTVPTCAHRAPRAHACTAYAAHALLPFALRCYCAPRTHHCHCFTALLRRATFTCPAYHTTTTFMPHYLYRIPAAPRAQTFAASPAFSLRTSRALLPAAHRCLLLPLYRIVLRFSSAIMPCRSPCTVPAYRRNALPAFFFFALASTTASSSAYSFAIPYRILPHAHGALAPAAFHRATLCPCSHVARAHLRHNMCNVLTGALLGSSPRPLRLHQLASCLPLAVARYGAPRLPAI